MSAAKAWHGFDCYVIYKNPKDFPDSWVVRHWVDLKADPIGAVCVTLDIARSHIPTACIRIPPMPGDDPVIFEVWI